MKKLTIILIFALVAIIACTKSKEVHPEIGDGNEEFITVGAKTAHVKYTRADIAQLQKVVFHYGLSGAQQFASAEMAKKEEFFDLTLNDLVNDTLYYYYYELFPNSGDVSTTGQKTFRTLAIDSPIPPIPPAAELPTVVTGDVSEITTNSAVCGGEVTNDGGSEVTERGLCWSTNENPTVNDNHVVVGEGIGAFSATISGLEANTTYHVRAYAINEKGTAYGLDKEFTTFAANGSAPVGAIDGLFTINENGDQVYFSQGNLQYQASTNTWRFAENQWDFVGTQTPETGDPGGTVTGSDNSLISSTYDGWIDLFGWGTSGWNNGNIYYQPYDIEYIYVFETGFGYGPTDGTNYCFDLIGDYANADWGVKNAIANGGNMPNLWRTLTYSEWSCLFFGRTTATGIRYARADVNGVGGVILLPDNWDPSIHALNNTNASAAHCYDNIITVADWEVMESYGAVFLPAASWRIESMVYQHSSQGGYWSSSYYDCHGVYGMFFENDTIFTDYDHRYYGHSVRLVRLAE